jgi:hypothetical protein
VEDKQRISIEQDLARGQALADYMKERESLLINKMRKSRQLHKEDREKLNTVILEKDNQKEKVKREDSR